MRTLHVYRACVCTLRAYRACVCTGTLSRQMLARSVVQGGRRMLVMAGPRPVVV